MCSTGSLWMGLDTWPFLKRQNFAMAFWRCLKKSFKIQPLTMTSILHFFTLFAKLGASNKLTLSMTPNWKKVLRSDLRGWMWWSQWPKLDQTWSSWRQQLWQRQRHQSSHSEVENNSLFLERTPWRNYVVFVGTFLNEQSFWPMFWRLLPRRRTLMLFICRYGIDTSEEPANSWSSSCNLFQFFID